MNNNMQPTIKTTTKIPFFRRAVLQNFPFIEKDFDALTDYELLCKVVEYLNKVIEQTNLMEDNENELVRVYNELYNYVEHYFDNLDVQEEINNKLDAMVEAGTLQEIIAEYLNSKAIFAFDNVASMKEATNLIDGSYAKTLGYYVKNDGGSGLYKIRTITNEDTVDNGSIIPLNDNTLVAELINNDNKVNVKQFGAKGDDSTDDTNAFSNLINYCNANLKNLYIPIGKYRIYNNLPSIFRGLCVIGENGNRGLWLNENRPLIRDLRSASTNEYLINYDSQNSSIRLGTCIYNILFYCGSDRNLNCINFDMEHGCYESIIENVSFIGFLRALKIEHGDDMTLSHVSINDCGGKENNSNIYAITIGRSVVFRMLNCLIEHSRWMVTTQYSTAHLVIQNCHFELAKHYIGYLGNPPITIDRGLIIGNTFVTRPVQTLATEMNIENIDDVYYMVSINKDVRLVNNYFTTGGSNDGNTDTNKKQGKFLTVDNSEDHGNLIISGNCFINSAFETTAINMRYIPNVVFSNNIISVLIEETTNNELFKNYSVIDNTVDTISGNNNTYKIQTSLSSTNNFSFLPRLTRSYDSLYRLNSQWWKSSSNKFSADTYNYTREASSFSNTPTMIIQGERGFFELEIYDKNTSNMYYKGIIEFDIRTGYNSVTESKNLIKKMVGSTINFIKAEDNKLIVQIIDVTKTHLVFRINEASRNIFVYRNNSYQAIAENITYSIS